MLGDGTGPGFAADSEPQNSRRDMGDSILPRASEQLVVTVKPKLVILARNLVTIA